MKGKQSRFEVNKEVRRALVRNNVDMTKLSYSCAGRNLRISGSLLKDDGRDFTAMSIEKLVEDIGKSGLYIISELDNWNITDGSVSKIGGDKEKEKKKAQGQKKTEGSSGGGQSQAS
ncbi:MAG: hypothetical protein KC493_16890 [Bacteriovoracaceae bacterium]|nr:hypothetical protein [Bacteriovoracaceae bacterium]